MPDNVYPQEFFNIQNPDAAIVNLQFRTQVPKDRSNVNIEDSDLWESVVLNPSNFFDSLSITDKGGAPQIDLQLFDKNFARLENVLVRSQVAARLTNKLVREPSYSADDTEYLEFYVSRGASVNMRLRIGYSHSSTNGVDVSSQNDDDWVNRSENDVIIRSPWLYFQITKMNFSFKQDGLEATVQGFSTMRSFLDKAKVVQKYAKYFGPPKEILRQIERTIKGAAEAASGGDETVSFQFTGEDPVGYPTQDGTNAIEVMLGNESAAPQLNEETGEFESRQVFKSLKQLLNSICSKVRPLVYDEEGNKVPQSQDTSGDGGGIDSDNEQADRTMEYTYVVREENNEIIIEFYYADPFEQARQQQLVRTYPWLEYGQSILTDVNIESKTDFAQLNLQIATVDPDSGEMTLKVAAPNEPEEGNQQSEIDMTLGKIKDVSDTLNSNEFDAMFVSDIQDTSQFQFSNSRLTSRQAAGILSRQVVHNLNQTIFEGSISMPGDAFYIFDSKVKPFSYLIKLLIKRPNYLDATGNFVEGGISYLSGYYVIKQIKHDVSTSGFNTTLEVMKFPALNEQND